MILFCFGTRPEWIKIYPILKHMDRKDYKLLFTRQHDQLFDIKHPDINIDYDIDISSGDNRLDDIISSCLTRFPEGEFDSVLVQGDTASAFACALAAYHRKLKIYYLEAGLRTYDLENPYPEEGYRQMISRISDVNLCPTRLSMVWLQEEKTGGVPYVVGNTVLDNLVDYVDDCEYQDKVLVTLHRRENHNIIPEWFNEINSLAKKYPHIEFLLPIHYNPNVNKHRNILTHVKVVDPMEHLELIKYLVKCKLVISDSGGLQEEGSFFNKKVIVCRQTTERPEGIRTGHLHLCTSPEVLEELFDSLINDYEINERCPYGDGNSGEKIVRLL